jgi:pantoate--beta-alanine ligase
MQRVTSISELQDALEAAKREGFEIAFVPTMGALHEGHLSLINEARRHAPFVVVSIFVNPLQFGAGEDFEKYPRTIEEDAAKLETAGVSVLFTPTVNDLYRGNMNVSESAGHIGELYEGAARPDHFDGMLTVVAKLFDAVRPRYAVFGAKDAQQVFLVKQMAAQKFPELEIVVAPTIREANGLALSSRNRYLSEADHKVAEHISAALRIGQATIAAGAGSPQAAIEAARTVMAKVPEAKLDYIALVDADTFEAVSDGFTGRAILLIAAVVGETRLIDNIEITF